MVVQPDVPSVKERDVSESINTDWSGIRYTDPKAHPVDYCFPKHGRGVVHVSKGQIRSALIEDAYFELADVKRPLHVFGGKWRAVVCCLWYGRKPPTSWMHLTLLGKYEEAPNYRGKVVWNIGR